MDMSGTDGLASGLMAFQQGRLQYEMGVRVAAKAMDSARSEGEAMVGLVQAAAKVMDGGKGKMEGALDVYA